MPIMSARLSKFSACSMILVLLISGAVAVDITATAKIGTNFKFSDFIKGEWEISIGQGSPSKGLKIDGDSFLLMNITEKDSAFSGQILRNQTDIGLVSEFDSVEIEFHKEDPNSGVFKTSNHLTEPMKPIYDFQFDVVPSGVAISIGHFQLSSGESKPYYFVVDSWDSFSFIITESEGKNTFWFAKRKIHVAPKSFFSKYGSTIMLVCVFIFNMVMQRKIRKVPERARPAVNDETAARAKTE